MTIEEYEKYLSKRSKWGRIVSLIGIVVLIGGGLLLDTRIMIIAAMDIAIGLCIIPCPHERMLLIMYKMCVKGDRS